MEEFTPMTAEQYRALSAEELEQRRNKVLDMCTAEDCDVDSAVLRSESQMIASEISRRETARQLRALDMQAALSGNCTVIDSTSALRSAAGASALAQKAPVDRFDTPEYRTAFMDYIQRSIPIPMELRSDQSTLTGDVPPMVPTTMGREIIRKMSEFGTIWNKVNKLNVKGGVWFRVLDLKPTASWIDEDKVSEFQKVSSNDKISFSFYELECRMSQSLLASAVTFDDFQALFVPAVAEAMVRALEQAIVRGDGNGKPLGFIVDPRVTNVVEMTKEEFGNWKAWHKNVKAKMPKSYRNGEFLMAQSSWDTYIETMSDDKNAPVSIGYNPVTGEEQLRLCGKSVNTTEPDIFPDFDAANAGDVVAAFGDLGNYAVNTQPGMPMTTKRWIDDDQNKEKIKALMACDGKVLDPYGFILIKKKASV